ncbi:cellulase family glycosylhydrolase [Cellulosilyticum ruminicola]|uniref:cellulase family glycosylhydrolase n=1 Tax=Cellulosilyticum ruminicola TaxID=425254 RepID=UPI0009F8F555|nr:cellulase family glycosylhydrolase [Cellulosilyticum ruminicola]
MAKFKTFSKKFQVVALSTVMFALSGIPVNVMAANDLDVFDQLSQEEITKAMGAGWNLGNTMEAFNESGPNEQMWGNPKVTPELFKAVKKAGFDTVRIPVSLLNYIGDAPEYKIKEDWLKRVKEVVDYAYDAGLYVILDGVHGDGYHTIDKAWLLITDQDQETVKAKYQKVWQQYAEVFKDYDEHIIFESMNEVFNGDYGNPDRALYKNINAYNQVFVDTIRKSGGNNADRWLLIPGWNTNIDHTSGNFGFELPKDSYRSEDIPSDEQRLMISVHYYSPYEFALDNSSSITQWGKIATEAWRKSSWGQEDYMDSQLALMYNKFVKKGYPVVIGEYCATDKTNQDPNNDIYRTYFSKTLCETCKKYKSIPVYWDIGAKGPGGSCLIDRKTYEVVNESIVNAIMEGMGKTVTEEPITPENPVQPTEPDIPVQPENPTQPTEPEKPDTPDIPVGNLSDVIPEVSLESNFDGTVTQNCSITSVGKEAMDLSKLTIRYYYDRKGTKAQSFWCDNAGLQLSVAPYYTNMTSAVQATFKENYLELSFDTNEVLETGAGNLTMQMRFAQSDWSKYSGFVDKGYEVYYDGVKVVK